MKTLLSAVLGLFVLVAPASGGHAGGPSQFFGGFEGFGGFGFGGHHGEFGGFGGPWAFGFLDPEQQERFESQLERLSAQYDEGVAEIDDFFNSTTYDRIVDKTELLDDRFGLFMSGVERNIDRLTDVIGIVNDDLTYYNDLLADYQADEDLSAERLARIERWIGRITDRLSTKIDFFTDTQSTLQTNLPTYQAFGDEVSTFLDGILAAGAGGTDTESTASAAMMMMMMMSSASFNMTSSEMAGGALSAATVPEPGAVVLILVGGAAAWAGNRRKRKS